MAPRFGTDGLRGLANQELTAEVALALGRATVEVLGGERFLIGSDTRISSPMLEAAMTAGICSAGGRVEPLGVVPTPAVAWASADRNAPAAMISASHNPYQDNGIKLFAPGGLKLRADAENDIQDRYLAHLKTLSDPQSPSPDPVTPVGAVLAPGSVQGWSDHVVASVAPNALGGLNLVIDCANGAACGLAAPIFERLGATVEVLGDKPNGTNINDGVGSTHPEALMAAVVASGADAGLALDGDADRLIAVDNTGRIVDGDRMLGLIALDWMKEGRLNENTVVVTVMTNLGFHRAMAEAGIKVLSTAVGDRHVLAALDDNDLSLGGEQSGHVICRDLATTGDGLLTGVQLMDLVARSGSTLAELASEVMTTVPQVLENVRTGSRNEEAVAAIAADVARIEADFGPDGRVLVRPSGTEPLLRIMVEHLDRDTAEAACERLVDAARNAAGGDN